MDYFIYNLERHMKDLLIMKNSYFTREKARNYTSSVDIADNKAKNTI